MRRRYHFHEGSNLPSSSALLCYAVALNNIQRGRLSATQNAAKLTILR